MNPALKNTLIILVILTLAFVGYYIFVQKDGNTDSLSFVSSGISPEVEERALEMIEISNTLKTIKIDTSVFSDERFQSYENISLPIQVQPVGNDNPFNQRL